MSKSFARHRCLVEILGASLGLASALLRHEGGHAHGGVSHLHRIEGRHGATIALRLSPQCFSSPLCSSLSPGCSPPLGLFTFLLGSLSLGFLRFLKLFSTGSSGLLPGSFPSLSGFSLLLLSFFSLFLESSSLLSLGGFELSLLSSGCESSLSHHFSFMSCGSLPLCNKSCSLLGSSLFLGCDLSLTTSMSGSSSGGCSSTCLSSSSSCCHILSVPPPEH